MKSGLKKANFNWNIGGKNMYKKTMVIGLLFVMGMLMGCGVA
jgi:hypothetical protein